MFSKHRVGFRVGVAAGLVGLVGLGMATVQASADELPDVTVKYADLDLNTTHGAELLYAGIASAAQQVCPGSDSIQLNRHMAALQCEDVVIAHSVAQISSPRLAAVYAVRSHHRAA
jgi:UrcA family protein